MLRPGASESFAGSPAGAAIPVRILAVADDKPPRIIRQSFWSIIPTQRELVLFFPNPESGHVRLRHFVDAKEELIENP